MGQAEGRSCKRAVWPASQAVCRDAAERAELAKAARGATSLGREG